MYFKFKLYFVYLNFLQHFFTDLIACFRFCTLRSVFFFRKEKVEIVVEFGMLNSDWELVCLNNYSSIRCFNLD